MVRRRKGERADGSANCLPPVPARPFFIDPNLVRAYAQNIAPRFLQKFMQAEGELDIAKASEGIGKDRNLSDNPKIKKLEAQRDAYRATYCYIMAVSCDQKPDLTDVQLYSKKMKKQIEVYEKKFLCAQFIQAVSPVAREVSKHDFYLQTRNWSLVTLHLLINDIKTLLNIKNSDIQSSGARGVLMSVFGDEADKIKKQNPHIDFENPQLVEGVDYVPA